MRGVFPIVVTPFHDDGSIDYASLDRLVDHLLEQGAHGLGLFGNASEGYTLAASERVEMLKRIGKRVDGKVPLVVSSGSTGTDSAVELSVQARDLGAAALMVLPPVFPEARRRWADVLLRCDFEGRRDPHHGAGRAAHVASGHAGGAADAHGARD
jgi:4-hydroxy-tetrahydrodipicolinate synthase